ncbi:PspC domain-containing protein [Nucisporomicrobium flavum]|uniref:PspC domain-containing protein n=1 Tax=Nucisporomicrobium flavum TaxID=2785915 RepID=UPI0018F3D830|nr:PspC domain-containing protein [Nucisporomicrobium flavum]
MTQPTVAPYKQLRRPLDDRIVAGVCSGIGRYLSVDPVLIRVGFAVLTVMTWGVGLLAYPIAWFLMPEEPAPAGPAWRDPADPSWGQPAGYPAGPAWTQPAAGQPGPTSTPPAA